MPADQKETYLGDGLYASFDGYQFKLRAPDLYRDQIVYLEPAVLHAFTQFIHETYRKLKENKP